MTMPRPDYSDLAKDLIDYFISLPLNTEVTIFDLVNEVCKKEFGNESEEYKEHIEIWILYEDFMKACRRNKLKIDKHIYCDKPFGESYNISFCRVDKHTPTKEEITMKKVLRLLKKYPIDKEVTIYDLLKEVYGEEEANHIVKVSKDYKYIYYLPEDINGYLIRTGDQISNYGNTTLKTPIRKTIKPIIKLRLLVGDITSDKILEGHDLIVCPSNPAMVSTIGVFKTVLEKAGTELEKYIQDTYDIHYGGKDYKKENIMKSGDIRIAPGFSLGMDVMFIIQSPRKWEFEEETNLMLYYPERVYALVEVYEKLLNLAYEKGYTNILLPSLGTDGYGFTHKETAPSVTKLLFEFVKDKDVKIDFVIPDRKHKRYYFGLQLNKIL